MVKAFKDWLVEKNVNEAQLGVVDKDININHVIYGNPVQEDFEIAQNPDNEIKNWFIKEGLIEKIRSEAPLNDSEITKEDLKKLVNITSNATAEEIMFARYVDDTSNLAQSFIDVLKENNYEISMSDFFEIDSQAEGILHFLKDLINRPRPYQLAKYYNIPLYPLIRTDAMSASYPSGHALSAYVMSSYYGKKYPDIANKLKELGEKIAKSREITGIHYPSDTLVSKKIAEIIIQNNLIKDR